VTDTESHNQALRLGKWSYESNPVVVVSTTGGSVQVVDPMPHTTNGTALAESPDYGYGGMALCVRQVNVPNGPQSPTIFFAPLWAHGGTAPGPTDMVSSLVLLERSTASALTEVSLPKFFDGGGANNPKLFGVCGIAVGDVDGATANGDPHDELVLTTVNGDLVVYDLVGNGKVALGASPLHWSIHDGSLGVCNSIVIADLDPARAGNEIYVAGSCGIRKFYQITN
jgi:hypothetical protein